MASWCEQHGPGDGRGRGWVGVKGDNMITSGRKRGLGHKRPVKLRAPGRELIKFSINFYENRFAKKGEKYERNWAEEW